MIDFANFQCESAGYLFRLARAEEAEAYFEQNYQPLDPDVVRLTGCQTKFERETVVNFLRNSLTSNDRYWFFLIAPNGDIVGEAVISEIDWQLKSGHFRLAIFQQAHRGKGLGQWLIENSCYFFFEVLQLNRLALEVYSFNVNAHRLYLKMGFEQEGRLKESILYQHSYADTILMAMLATQWKSRVKN